MNVNTTSEAPRKIFTLLSILGIGMLVLNILIRFSGHHVWDDAFMFYRYAHNWINAGIFSWQPGGETVYGPTSLVHTWIVGFFHLVLGERPAIVLICSSLSAGVACFLIIWKLVSVSSSGLEKSLPGFSLAFTSLSFGLACPFVSTHFVSGMDTMLAMAWLSGMILLGFRHKNKPSVYLGLILGFLGALTWWIRPELILFPLIMSLSFIRKDALWKTLLPLSCLLICLLAETIIARIWLRSWLPLSVYAKVFLQYDTNLREIYAFIPIKELITFFLSNWFIVLLFLLGPILGLQIWWKQFNRFDRAILATTLLCMGFWLLGTLQIMFYSQRFYYPIWPALVFLAVRNLDFVSTTGLLKITSRARWVMFGAILGAMLLLQGLFLQEKKIYSKLTDLPQRIFVFDEWKVYGDDHSHNWPGLELLSALPDQVMIATTEVGYPAALNPGKEILDLAGLNEPLFAKTGFSVDTLLSVFSPDIIYLPHPDYGEINQQLKNSAAFNSRYLVLSPKEVDGYLGLALLKESPWFEEAKRAITQE